MSTYTSILTGHAPDGFNLDHTERFLDVAYDLNDPTDIRLILWGTQDPDDPTTPPDHHLTPAETQELATRLLIATGAPQDIINQLLALQSDAPHDTHL